MASLTQRLRTGLCSLFLFVPLHSLAHDPGLSDGIAELGRANVNITLHISEEDFHRLENRGEGAFTVNGAVAEAKSVEPGAPNGMLLRFISDIETDGAVDITAPFLSELPRGHRLYFRVEGSEGTLMAEKLLSSDDFKVALTAEETTGPFGQFVMQGIWHILIGLDHLAFLLLLVLPAAARATGHWRSLVTVVTAFTVGHSMTLTLATLDVVNIPSGPVEAAIAASIVVAGILNFRTAQRFQGYWLALLFGLVHGLGFASVLAELSMEPSQLVLSLLAFNLGVEVGQLALVALAWPFLRILSRGPLRYRTVPVGSVVVGGLGAYWLVERLAALTP